MNQRVKSLDSGKPDGSSAEADYRTESIAEAAGNPFRRRELLERLSHDMGLLEEIVLLFLEDYPKQLVKIRDSLERSDSEALERASHALKGSVSNFLADSARQAADRLERMGRHRELQGAKKALEELERQLARLRPALQGLIRGGRVDS